MYLKCGKRTLDLLLVISTMPIWLPLWGVLILLVRLKLGSPVHFVQMRPGLHAVPFKLCKLRSMSLDVDANGVTLPDKDRMTPFGTFLRRTSLDEIPTLWNVMHGDMSLVGPRPLLMEYLPLYSSEQRRRHEVRPGITGLAQVSGRNALTWEDKFRLDVEYVDNLCFSLDIRVLLRTFFTVIRKENINQEGEVTMKPFSGKGE